MLAKSLSLWLSAVALALTPLVLPATAQELVIEHAQGSTTLPKRPDKVVVLDVAALDTLAVLGVDPAGVAAGATLPDFLSRYKDAKRVGSLFEPDYEAIAEIDPDLIIVGGRSAAKYADLAKLAPTVDLTVDRTRFIASVKERADILGRLFAKEKDVEALKDKLDASIAAARELAPKAGKALFVMTNGAKVIAFGPGSRFGWIHDDLGIEPVAKDVKSKGSHGEVISFEYMLEKNPDSLFVLDRDAAVGAKSGASAAKTLDNELVAKTKAWSQDNVLYLDARRLYIIGNGLPSTTAIVDQIADALRK